MEHPHRRERVISFLVPRTLPVQPRSRPQARSRTTPALRGFTSRGGAGENKRNLAHPLSLLPLFPPWLSKTRRLSSSQHPRGRVGRLQEPIVDFSQDDTLHLLLCLVRKGSRMLCRLRFPWLESFAFPRPAASTLNLTLILILVISGRLLYESLPSSPHVTCRRYEPLLCTLVTIRQRYM